MSQLYFPVLMAQLMAVLMPLMAQEGAIVQITHCFILKYIKHVTKGNISVKARDKKWTFP